ncbi:hypothetical protein M427DRAFT_301913 [Gonapodya prolifera JEL478]|uniref:Thioredoxin domain-containing protein n=1 Tax=Gonapodya prolifera (strain JEL478) TaxID=1344416 RepID=A0A139AHE0_GONPJ|nr:hypothetical protein M427DRAFT_301913 [Gonapodya prolifera JEL478]|eukprot:KXS16148.1 hypothetical protein M427DRAFT_301913 [Gonapodya prolifera JEL478]
MAQNNSRLFEAHVSSTLTPDAPVTNKSRILDDSPMSSRSSLSGGFQARVNGDIAPNFEATNTKGMRFALNEALSRRDFVVLNFWSKGWCLFDNQTVKPSSLSKVYGKFPAKCEVVFISPDNAEQTARIEGKKETSLVFLPDPSMKLSRLYGAAKEDEEQAVGPGEPIAGTFIIAAEKDPDTKGTRGRIIHVYMGVDSFTKSETLKLAALAIVRHMTEMSQRRDRESSAKPNGKQKQRRHTITAGAGAEEETAKRAVESRRKKSVAGCKQQ